MTKNVKLFVIVVVGVIAAILLVSAL